MAYSQTPQEIEQQCQSSLGPDLGPLYYRLWNESAWLHFKWSEYVILFGSAPTRVDLLNRAAPSFFRLVQDSLWEDVLLHICRLTDPPQSAGKSTLSLQRLPPLVATGLRPRIDTLLNSAISHAAFARDWRNRHIAHRDLALALNPTATPLAHASRQSVNLALQSIASLLNAISEHYFDSSTHYDLPPSHGNAESLLYVLRDGLEVEVQRQQRLRSGTLLPQDLTPPSAV